MIQFSSAEFLLVLVEGGDVPVNATWKLCIGEWSAGLVENVVAQYSAESLLPTLNLSSVLMFLENIFSEYDKSSGTCTIAEYCCIVWA